MRHGSLFSGIGGFDLAAEWMGWENVFQVEKDGFCQKVLAKNFPNTARYGDIKEFDGTKYAGRVDVLSGGFPCQPFSSAGKRKGTDDDRYLWPEMLRVIREVQPAYIVGENVYGLVNWSGGLVFEQVCSDLENEGYQVQPVILPACAVDAPHRRDRVWFVAYSESNNDRGLLSTPSASPMADILPGTSSGIRLDMERDKLGKAGREKSTNDLESPNAYASNTASIRWLQGVDRDESKEFNPNRKRGAWQNFPTQPPLRDGNDGIPAGLVRSAIHAGGNAVVPQVVYEIFKAINQVNDPRRIH